MNIGDSFTLSCAYLSAGIISWTDCVCMSCVHKHMASSHVLYVVYTYVLWCTGVFMCVSRYSYDVTGMHDISEQPSLLHAVEEQLLVCFATLNTLAYA